MDIGFGTGDFWNTNIKPISVEVLDHIFALGCTAVEFAAQKERWLGFESIPAEKVQRFSYRSLHAPSDMTPDDILFLKSIQDKYDLHTITVHPKPNIGWKLLKQSGLRVAVENMDNKKDYGITPASIKNIVLENNFKWVFDVNHVFTHDTSMKLAKDFLDELGPPAHVHLSGYTPANIHTLLYKTLQNEIIDAVTCNCPIVIESELGEIEDAARELEYIKKFF